MAERIRFTDMGSSAQDVPEPIEKVHQRLIDGFNAATPNVTKKRGPGRYSARNAAAADAAEARDRLIQFELDRLNSGELQE